MRHTVPLIEAVSKEICLSSYPHEWDENFLSYSLMKALRNCFRSREIQFQDWSKIVDWKSYKNKGKIETRYGDISLIVNIQFSSGETLKGIAFLEAKRTYSSHNFEAMDQQQLVRIRDIVPYAQVLLYNHKCQELQLKFPDEKTWKSHLWVSPINTAIQHNQQLNKANNQKLLRTSFPFSSFLTSRIFWGFDLDFREAIYNDVASGEGNVLESSFLGVINVYYEGQNLVPTAIGDIWEEIR